MPMQCRKRNLWAPLIVGKKNNYFGEKNLGDLNFTISGETHLEQH